MGTGPSLDLVLLPDDSPHLAGFPHKHRPPSGTLGPRPSETEPKEMTQGCQAPQAW